MRMEWGTIDPEDETAEHRSGIRRSDPAGGCGLKHQGGGGGCNCSPGHWINIGNGQVWITTHFDDRAEMDRFFSGYFLDIYHGEPVEV